MPFCAWPPFSPVCPPGPDSPLRGEAVPGKHRPCRQQQQVTPLLFSAGFAFVPEVCPRSLTAAPWGRLSPYLGPLSGPPHRLSSPVPQPGAVPPVPLSAPPGDGGTKGPSVPAGAAGGERLRLGGAPSHRGSLRPLPAGATAPGPPRPLPGAPRERVTVPFCD